MALNLSNRMTNSPEKEGKNIRRRLYLHVKAKTGKVVQLLRHRMCGEEGGLP